MTDGKIYVGDTGTVIELDAGVDLSSQTSIMIVVKKPDGSETTWSAAVKSSDPTKCYHITAAGDLDQAGVYRLQIQATLSGPSGTWTGRGETAILSVYDLFK